MNDIFDVLPEDDISERGYKTTFYQDFSIAEPFGSAAIEDTFNRAFNEWKGNYKYLTELVIVLNHKMWDWFSKSKVVSSLYENLFKKAAAYAEETLNGEELYYYYHETD